MMRWSQRRIVRIIPYLGLVLAAGISFVFVPAGETLWARVLGISGTVNTGHFEPPDFEGCSPGFWKQPKRFDEWPGVFSPDDLVAGVFGSNAPEDLTLLEALQQGGGGVNALLRQAVAALLNAAHEDVEYSFSLAEVVEMVMDALDGGDVEATKNALEAANELGCELGDDEDDDDDGEDGDEGACEDNKGGEEGADDGEGDDNNREADNGEGDAGDDDEGDDDEVDARGNGEETDCEEQGEEEEDCEEEGEEECKQDDEESSDSDNSQASLDLDAATEGGDSCEAEYWGNQENLTSWPGGLTPEALFSDVFGVTLPESPTLFEALSLEGDGGERLMKAGTAALLNALSPASQSESSAEEIIELFQTAYLSGDPELIAVTTEQLEGLNVGDCTWLADTETDTLTESGGEALEPTPTPTPGEPTPTETAEPDS